MCRPIGAVLVIDAMKSVATDSVLDPSVRSWIDGCVIRQCAMEAGVEYRDLRLACEDFFCDVDSLKARVVVQGCDFGDFANCALYGWIDPYRLRQFGPAMNDAMTNDFNFART